MYIVYMWNKKVAATVFHVALKLHFLFLFISVLNEINYEFMQFTLT